MAFRVLITGGLGNIGYWLTRHFCGLGCEVFVLTRRKMKPDDGLNYKIITANIEDFESLKNSLVVQFQFCVHLAGAQDYFQKKYFVDAISSNVLGTRNLIEVLSLQSSFYHFIYFSTFHVYGKDYGVIDENTKPAPKNDYAMTHYFCELYLEQFCRDRTFPSTILRVTNAYGCPIGNEFSKWYLVLNDFAKSAFEKQKITIRTSGLAARDFVWQGDICLVVDKIITLEPKCETYNLASGFSHKIIDIANLVSREYEERYKIKIDITIGDKDDFAPIELSVDNSKLKKLINFNASNMLCDEIRAIFDYLEKRNNNV